jgi:hypothetical protein
MVRQSYFQRLFVAITLSCLLLSGHAEAQMAYFPSAYSGYDPTGAADSTTALQACLSAAGAAKGTCFVNPGASLKVLGGLMIPGNTTLKCGFGFSDNEVNPAAFAATPAIVLDGAHTITAGGEGARIENCLVYRNGMTFPAADSSAYTGTAISDGGYSDFQAIDDVVLGFDTDIYVSGGRPYLRHLHLDGSGVSRAVLELDVGNTDSGNVEDVKIQSIATGFPSCAAVQRPGVGLRVGGSVTGAAGVWLDNVVVQNFQVRQYEFLNSAIVGRIWADNVGVTCGYGSTIGVYYGPGANVNADQIYTDQQYEPFYTESNNNRPRVNLLSISFGFGGLLLGSPTNPAALNVGTLLIANISTWGIYVWNPTTDFYAEHVYFSNVNNRAAPYIWGAYPTVLGNTSKRFFIGGVFSDLGPTVSLYSSIFKAGSGSAPMLRGLGARVGGCAGLGSGNCSMYAGADSVEGKILISPQGSPTSSGSATLTRAMPSLNYPSCTITPTAEGDQWPSGTAFTAYPPALGAPEMQFQWTAAPLIAGHTYAIGYHCEDF